MWQNGSFLFSFESDFDNVARRQWMTDHWNRVLYYLLAYVLLISVGPVYMKSRPPFELRPLLAVWNFCFASFSLMGALRTIPEFLHSLRDHGFHYSVCNPSYVEQNKISGYWTWLFTLSKVPELGDTIFIVLRKQRLLFLHWYHHILAAFYCWYTYREHTAMARWFIWMNYSIHSIMYSYFGMRALKFRLPRSFAVFITTGQILQMVVASFISIYAYYVLVRGYDCTVTFDTAKLSFLMYFSFCLLFGKLFYDNYLRNGKLKLKLNRATATTTANKNVDVNKDPGVVNAPRPQIQQIEEINATSIKKED